MKIEGTNPTGSLKDRMALAMLEVARRRPPTSVVATIGVDTTTKYAFEPIYRSTH